MALARPIRFNPVRIEVVRQDGARRTTHKVYQEPKQVREREPSFVVLGQVNTVRRPGRFRSRDRSTTGDREPGSGHVLFRKVDLDAAGYMPRNGDEFIKFAALPVDFVVRNVRPESALQGDFLLYYAEYEEPHFERESV